MEGTSAGKTPGGGEEEAPPSAVTEPLAPNDVTREDVGARASTSDANSADQASKKKSTSVHIHEPPVTETRGYQIVKIEEKHGVLHRAIPVMPLGLAIICCFLNIVLPGIGECRLYTV